MIIKSCLLHQKVRENISTVEDLKTYQKEINTLEKDITLFQAEVVDKTIKKQLKNIALKAFYKHGCQTWGRVDFVYDGENFGVLEINTVPSFTEKSLFPLAAKLSGINYQELITDIIEDSI